MIFYTAIDSQGRTHWETTQADARAVNKTFEKVDVPVDKPGLHVWLNATQQKIDELRDQIAEGGEGLPELDPTKLKRLTSLEESGLLDEPLPMTAAPRAGYTEQSVNWDELFPTLPLAHQLHFAAMALENAREQL